LAPSESTLRDWHQCEKPSRQEPRHPGQDVPRAPSLLTDSYSTSGRNAINQAARREGGEPSIILLGSAAIILISLKELAPRTIRVNSVNPGATFSEGSRAAGLLGAGSEFEKHFLALTPLGRIGTPADIAKVVAFLASDDSGWLTGEIILATGGLR
jgi:hypothetical protein